MMKRSWLRNWFSRRVTSPIRKDAPRVRLAVETLEDRTVPATFTVVNTTDAAVGSLRWAVGQANANAGADTIDFDSGVFSSSQLITLTSGQIDLTDTATTTITGPGVSLLSVSGNNASRMFNVNASASGSILGMTLTGGLVNGALLTPASAGAAVYNAGTLQLTNLTVTGNSANGGGGGGFGGAVHSQGDTALTNCTVSGNTGIGMNSGNGSGTLTVSNCTFSSNTLRGMQVGGGRARITDTAITGNLQQGVNAYVTDLTMTNCTVSGNSYNGDGAGVGIGLGTASLTNCTITGNTALGNGGGISLRGTATLTNCTITGNTAARGGGLDVFSGTPTFANTIVAGNTAANGPDVGGTTNPQAVTSLGHNLIGKTNGSTGWVGSDLTGTIASPLNAQLATLANNGGVTQTMAPLSGSPAINAGNSTLAPSEVQDITVSGSSGTFTLTFNGQTTSSLAFNAAAGTVQTALNALSSIGGVSGSVTVTKSSNVYRVTFGGALANQNLAQMTAVGASGATTAVLTLVNGNTDQRGMARFGNTDIGAFEHQFKVTSTADTGAGSLRQAIANANAILSADTIVFSTLFNSAQTITLTSGELALNDGATTTITGPGASLLSVSGNNASRVFNTAAGASAAISGLTVTGGDSAQGGGLFNRGTLSLTSVTISGNTAGGFFGGGGLFNNAGATATLANVLVSGNTSTAGSRGGAGINNWGAMTVTNSTISGNSALDTGGGFANRYSATATLTNVTVSGNTATLGAGVDMDGQNAGGVAMTLAMINCTISGNTATAGAGGGFYAIRGGTATMTNVTVSGNTASVNGGGFAISFGGSTLTLANTIVADNTSGSGPDASGALGTIVSQGHNLIGKTDTSTGWVGSDLTGTIASPLNAQLGALANNGGTTQTVALLSTSPAINAGDPTLTVTDQRALPRFGNTDIGAFEYQFKVTTTADSGNGSLRQALVNANSSTSADTVVFTSLFNAPQTIPVTSGTLTLTDAAGVTLNGPSATLSISGNAITNNAPLTINASNSINVSNVIGGTGGLTKAGAGTLTLSGTNAYSGVTTISAGTLQIGAGGSTGTLGSGAVIDDASLVFNKSTNTLVGNAISGTGSLTVNGAGTVILTNSNSYANTIINSGGLQIGIAGTTGTLGVGAVTVNGGDVSFNRSGSTTVSNVISGSGLLAQIGPAGSTVILTGANSYGTTQIDNGTTLQIGNGGTTGTLGTGAVADNGTLAFNRSDSITVANVISGSGALTQSGAGTTILTAANTYSGTTTISAGTLQVGNGGTTGSLGTGAVIDNATLTYHRSNSINVANAISGSGTLNLISTGGAITQTASISIATLVANAATGITLTNAGNAIGNFSGITASGGIDVRSSAAFTVHGATAVGDIVFTTIDSATIGQDLTIAGDITSTTGSILLRGGDDVTVQPAVTLQAATTITVYGDYGNADPGIGTTVIVASTPLTSPTHIAIFGNMDDDTFDVSAWTGTATVDGADNVLNSNEVLGGNVVSFTFVDLITLVLHRLAGFGDITQKNVNRIDLTIPEFTDRSINASALTQDLTIHDPGNGNVTLILGSGTNFIEKEAPADGVSTGTTHEYVAGTGSTTYDIGPGSDVIINTSFSTSSASNVLKFTKAKVGVSFDVSMLNMTQTVDSSGNTVKIIDTQNRIIPTVVGSQFADTLSNTGSYAGVLTLDGGGGADTITNTGSNITTLRATAFDSFSNTGSNLAIDVSGTSGGSFSSTSSDFSVNATGTSFSNTFSAQSTTFRFVATDANFQQASFSINATSTTFSALAFDGDEIIFDGDEVIFDGDETIFNGRLLNFNVSHFLFDGDEITFDGDEITFDGDEITFDGDEITFDGDEVTFDGDEITFNVSNIRFDGDETTFQSVLFDGDEVIFDGDEITFDGDEVTFNAAARFDGDEVTFNGLTSFHAFTQFNGQLRVDAITGLDVQALTVHATTTQFATTALFDGDEIIFDGDEVTFSGAAMFGQLLFDGDEVTFTDATFLRFDGDEVIFNSTVRFDGDEITFTNADLLFDGDEVTFNAAVLFDGDEITFDGDEVTFNALAQFDGDEVTFNGLAQFNSLAQFSGAIPVGTTLQKLAVHANGVQFGTTTLFDGDEIIFDGDEVTFNGATLFGQLSISGTTITSTNASSLHFDGDEITFMASVQFDGDEIIFDGDEIIFDGDEVIFDGDEITFDGDEVIFDGDEVIFSGRVITFDGDEVIFDGDEVIFDGDIITFTNADGLFDGDEVIFNAAVLFDGDEIIFDRDEVTFNALAQFDGDEVTFNGLAQFNSLAQFSGGIQADTTQKLTVHANGVQFGTTTLFDGDEIIFDGDEVIFIGATVFGQLSFDGDEVIFSRANTVLFDGDEVTFRGTTQFDGDEVIFDGDEVTFQGSVKFDGDEVTFRGNGAVFSGSLSVFDGDEIIFDGDEVTFGGVAGFLATQHANISAPNATFNLVSFQGANFVVDLTSATIHQMQTVGDQFHLTLAGAQFDQAFLSASHTTINAVGAVFADLTNTSDATYSSIDVSGANFTSLTNNAEYVTVIKADGATFGRLSNTANHVTDITARNAAFQVIQNSGSNIHAIIAWGSLAANSVINSGSDIANIDFQGRAGNDAFVNTGNRVVGSFLGEEGDDSALISGAGLNLILDGGAGNDTFTFTGDIEGDIEIASSTGVPSNDWDSLDFASFDTTDINGTPTGISLNLGNTAAQTVKSGLSLQLWSGIKNVTGTAGNDTIIGNDLDNTILGAGLPDERITSFSIWNGRTQVMYLDFDTYTNKESQSITVNADQGTFTVSFDNVHSGPLPFNISALQLQAALASFSNIGAGNVAVEMVNGVYIVHFQNALAGQDVPQLIANGVNLLKGTEPGSITVLTIDRGRTDEHDYTVSERNAIQARMESIYTGFQVVITQNRQEAVAHGVYAPVYFNRPRIDETGGEHPGGQSDELDFRNQSFGGTLVIQVNGLLNPADESTLWWVNASANIAIHEIAHMLGVRHADAFGPIGLGIHNPPGADVYADPYAGLATAFETNLHILTSPASTGSDLLDEANDLYFGEREAIRLAMAFYAPQTADGQLIVAEQASAHATDENAQALALVGLNVPNTLHAGAINYGKQFYVAAVNVVGSMASDQETDVYSFEGISGDLINMEVISDAIIRTGSVTDPINAKLEVFNAAGTLIASNDNEFESIDAQIIDLRLPSSGTYYVKITTTGFNEDDVSLAFPAEYEFFLYRFTAANVPTSGDYIDGGVGDDTLKAVAQFSNTLIGGPGMDTIAGSAFDAVDSVLVNVNADSTPSTIAEGASFSGVVSITNLRGTSWTATVNYGDGSAVETLHLAVPSFALSHQYRDNGSYDIAITVTNDDGTSGTTSWHVTATNMAPGSVVLSPTPINGDRISTLTGVFTDPGTLDSHTVVISWGDGTPDSTLTLAPGVLTFSTTHHYVNNPTNGAAAFIITATVTDKDMESDSGTASVMVETLMGKDNQDNTWYITGHNQVQLYGVTYEGVKKLIGGNQADTFVFLPGGAIDETIDGGAGVNTLDYSAYATSVSIDLDAGTASNTGGVTQIRDLIGGAGNDTLVGDAQDNVITGNAGSDSLDGGAGNDTYRLGQGGDDTIHDASGNDRLDFSTSISGVNVNLGWTGGERRYIFNDHNDDSVEDHDHYDDVDQSHEYELNNSHNTLAIYGAIENVVGSAFDDRITGSDAANIIDALGGNNKIWSGDGDDIITAGVNGAGGNNRIYAGQGNDTITVYGNGNNHVRADGGGDTIFIYGNGANVVLAGNGNNSIAITGNGSNHVTTGSGNDSIIVNGNGANQIDAGSGNDLITVNGNGANQIDAGSGNDIVYGGTGNDNINGGSGDDILVGGDGNDIIVGGEGNDMLVGGIGCDTLQGGAGHDVLIAGTANVSTAALQASLASWVADAVNRDATNTDTEEFVLIENENLNELLFDIATGNSGADLFILGTNDQVTDFIARGSVTTTNAEGHQVQEGTNGDVVIWLN